MADYPIQSWSLHKVVWDTTGVEITQIQNYNVSPNVQIQRVSASGDPTASFAAAIGQGSIISLTTTDLETAISEFYDSVNHVGAAVIPDPVKGPISLFFVKREQNAPTVFDSEAVQVTINAGLGVLRSITATEGTPATAVIEITVCQDENNDPLTVTSPVAVPVLTQAQNVFGCGTAWVNDNKLEQIAMQSIDLGVAVSMVPNAGQIGPAAAFAQRVDPTIRITTTAGRFITDYGFSGGLVTSALFHFQKFAEGSNYIAPNVGQHIKAEMFEGMLEIMPINTGMADLIAFDMMFHPTNDSNVANEILELTTSTTIADPTP